MSDPTREERQEWRKHALEARGYGWASAMRAEFDRDCTPDRVLALLDYVDALAGKLDAAEAAIRADAALRTALTTWLHSRLDDLGSEFALVDAANEWVAALGRSHD